MVASAWAPGSTVTVNTNTTRVVQEFTAAGGQTTFILTNFIYVPGTQSLEVFKNGLLVPASLVTEVAGGASFIIAACALNDKIIAIGIVGITGSVTVPADGSVTLPKLNAGLVIPINQGGTGAITAPLARTALGITPGNIGALSSGDIGVSVQAYDVNTVKKNVANVFTAQQTPMNGALTDAGTITWDANVNGQVVAVTLAGSRSMGAPTNTVQYASYVLRVTQDGTGARTLTWNAAFKFGTAGAPTLTATPNKTDILGFIGGAGGTLEYTGIRPDAV
jgi:hypothetical protein